MKENLVEMKVNSWTRLRVFGLAIEPELLGQHHRFTYAGFGVELALPDVSMVDRQSTHDQLAHRTSYRVTPEGEIPLEICVHNVDMRISVPETFSLPAAMLERPCCATELISIEQQEQLFQGTQSFGKVALRAHSHWLEVTRWVMRDGTLGRPPLAGLESGWSTYFEETTSRHRIWSERKVVTVQRQNRISQLHWTAIQRLMTAEITVPAHWVYLLEAQQLLDVGDLRRAGIDGALALEAFLRAELENAIPPDLPSRFKEMLRRARLSELLSKKTAASFIGEDVVTEIGDDSFTDLRGLVECRNHLVHGGNTLPLEGQLHRWLETVRYLMVTFERRRERFSEFGFPR